MITPPTYIIASKESRHWLTERNQWSPDKMEAIRVTEEQARIITANAPTQCDAWRV